jgi:putative transposase
MLESTPRYHRRSIRLPGYDYAQPGAYFITLTASGMDCLFGRIVAGEMHLSQRGKIVKAEIETIRQHFPYVHIDSSVIMPNHVHLILVIDDWRRGNPSIANQGLDTQDTTVRQELLTAQDGLPRLKGPPSGSVGAIIAQFKSRATKRIGELAKKSRKPLDPVWQRNYYEHIIRNEAEWERIRLYIQNNPQEWDDDCENLQKDKE